MDMGVAPYGVPAAMLIAPGVIPPGVAFKYGVLPVSRPGVMGVPNKYKHI